MSIIRDEWIEIAFDTLSIDNVSKAIINFLLYEMEQSKEKI